MPRSTHPWLESPIVGKYFYLYMIIDLFSRKVVGWGVAAQESGALARKIFAHALEAEGVCADQLIVHADNGKPMRSRTLRKLFELLAVTASHGRPHTSNDNAYAESLFATFKGRVAYPEYFRSLRAAREFCAMFFTWYNTEHLHSGLDYLTPIQVHSGAHRQIHARRNALLAENRRKHPQRHSEKEKVYAIPETVRLKHRVILTEQQDSTRTAAPVIQPTYQTFAN
jgi:transposase InsO family protein